MRLTEMIQLYDFLHAITSGDGTIDDYFIEDEGKEIIIKVRYDDLNEQVFTFVLI